MYWVSLGGAANICSPLVEGDRWQMRWVTCQNPSGRTTLMGLPVTRRKIVSEWFALTSFQENSWRQLGEVSGEESRVQVMEHLPK